MTHPRTGGRKKKNEEKYHRCEKDIKRNERSTRAIRLQRRSSVWSQTGGRLQVSNTTPYRLDSVEDKWGNGELAETKRITHALVSTFYSFIPRILCDWNNLFLKGRKSNDHSYIFLTLLYNASERRNRILKI